MPLDRVIALPGVQVDALALAIAQDHPGLTAVVAGGLPALTTSSGFVQAAVADLERVAVETLPGWLPEAAAVGRPDLAGLAAIRLVAADRARQARYPVAFLTDLAVLALAGGPTRRSGLPMRARAAALARIVAEAFDRPRVVLLVDLDRVAVPRRPYVAAGAEWLVHHGGPAVWLLGGSPAGLDQVPVVRLPAGEPADHRAAVGRPHPASTVEAALEAALARENWAAGRRWNQTYQSTELSAPVRLDLIWPDDHCVVELDGLEHCRPLHFEADRQRDVQLQLDGYAVLRFTNARVTNDVGAVVHQIGTYLRTRRRDIAEGRNRGRR
ncbi:endonuclease domain-containing protein [Micromonosporaceae bacterium Da 78-11]